MSEEIKETTGGTLSMDDFAEEIDRSFKQVKEGDIISGTVSGISDTEVTVDLGFYAEGIIKPEELSNDPRFSMKEEIQTGDKVSALVLDTDDGRGNILLSLKRANDILAWDKLKEGMKNGHIFTVKAAETVNAGLTAYLEGIRAFIPASQITNSYVEDLSEWVGKEVDVKILDADKSKNRLILSGKEVAREREQEEKYKKIAALQKGIVTTGKIDKIMPYGCFADLGNGLNGLIHISQICGRHIKHPNEVVKEGQEVTVKIIDIKDGKISLSMKAVEDQEEVVEDVQKAPVEYSSGEEATTGLGALLAGIKIKE